MILAKMKISEIALVIQPREVPARLKIPPILARKIPMIKSLTMKNPTMKIMLPMTMSFMIS